MCFNFLSFMFYPYDSLQLRSFMYALPNLQNVKNVLIFLYKRDRKNRMLFVIYSCSEYAISHNICLHIIHKAQ